MHVKMPAGGLDFFLTCTHVHIPSFFFFSFASLHLASICLGITVAFPKVRRLCLSAAADLLLSALRVYCWQESSIFQYSPEAFARGGTRVAQSLLGGADGVRRRWEQVGAGA